jgi:hypothetical protein
VTPTMAATSATNVAVVASVVVVVSVPATGPKGRGLKPGRGDRFLKAIKIRNTPSDGNHVRFYEILKIP